VLDLSPETVGVFDVVFFLGVLYHMKHPLLALERVSSVTRELLIMSTFVDATWTRRPAAAFYPRAEANSDPTNWWGPNPGAVVAMLETAGFTRVDVVDGPTPLGSRLKVGVRRRLGGGAPILPTLWQGAIVCHARP
jgi:tRNA (mo5U34)-methyltransferase